MDKLTGEAIETEPVNKQFRPSSSDGVVVLEFKVPREAVNGMTVVVFEECTLDGKAVAIHADIEDAAQTVRLVEKSMRTTATAGAEGGKILHLDGVSEKAVIVDTVSYTGLVPNRNYTVSGTIHINNDGADAGTLKTEDGEDIVVTKTFAPSESDGTVEMQFEFDSSLLSKDQKLVVFEELYLGSEAEGEPILTHKDISDENQTVTVDEVIINIRTTALSGDGTKNVMADEEASVVDKVVYEGLTVGESYQLKGELHLVNADGSDGGVIAEGRTIDFTPGAENGTALMECSRTRRKISSSV